MSDTQTKKRFPATKAVNALLISVLFVLLLVLGWWSGEIAARRLDAEMRDQLLLQVEDISSVINPELVRKLAFTAADKSSPAFEHIRQQMLAASKTGSQRGIYSMAVRNGTIVFGPGTYAESDPLASPYGTVYEKPSSENWQVLRTGKPAVVGPYSNEYGSFITALAPVFDPLSGSVLMAIGIDILARDWQANLSAARHKPLLMSAVMLLMLIAGFLGFLRRRNRYLKSGFLSLKRWIMVPTAVVMLGSVILYAVYENNSYTEELRKDMLRSSGRTQMLWNRSVASQAQLLKSQLDKISQNPEMLKAWDERDLKVLSTHAQPVFQHLNQEYGTSHFYFITPDRICFLRAHQPDRRGDVIGRITLKTAQSTGDDAWGLEMGPLGSFTLRYVRPLIQEGVTRGYLELGTEIDIIFEQLAHDINTDFITVVRKASTSREKFEAGRKTFGFTGTWDAYPDFVVTHQTLDPLPDEVGRWLENDYSRSADNKVFTAWQGVQQFSCGVTPLSDAGGYPTAAFIVMNNITVDANLKRADFLMNLGLMLLLFCALLLMLWLLSGTAEQQLSEAFAREHESETLFRGLFDNSLSGVAIHKIIVDDQGKPVDYVFLQVNPAFEKHTGLCVADVLGRRVTEVYPYVKGSKFIETYGNVALNGEPVAFEQFVEQQQAYYNINAFQVGPGQFATVFQNITEGKLAEKSLQTEKDNLKAVFASSPAGMLLLDENLVVTGANDAIGRLTGKEVGTLVQQRIGAGLGCIHSVEDARGCGCSDSCRLCSLRSAIEEVLATESSVHGAEIQPTLMQNGTEHKPWLLVSVEPTFFNGRSHLVVAIVDITKLKDAEEALKVELLERRRVEAVLHETESLMMEAQQLAHMGTGFLTIATGQTQWSDEIYHILGLPVGAPLSFVEFCQCLHPDDIQILTDTWYELNEEKPVAEMKFRIVRPSGEIRYVHQCVAYKFDESYKDETFVTLLLDITEIKNHEDEMLLAQQAAEAANIAKSEFLASMSHEIRTPMNAIIGMAELLSDTQLDSEQHQYVEVFKNAGQNLMTLINDILDLSKVEAGQIELEKTDFNLTDLIEKTCEVMAMRAHKKGLELNGFVAEDVEANLIGDPTRLRQIIINLIGNAVKFTEKGEIFLKIENAAPEDSAIGVSEEQKLLFTVHDTGIGIPPGKVDLIFDRFTQADSTTTRRFGGTGLGLAITRQLTELMGGRIWVESVEGSGSTFCFTATFEKQPCNAAATVVSEQSDIKGLKVLIVDDTATNRLILRKLMTAMDCDVVEAEDGPTALGLLRKAEKDAAPFNLVLLDVRMPGMDGFTVAGEIQNDPALHAAAVMVLSSDNRRGDIDRVKELGVQGYLVKPFKRAELRQAVRAVLGSHFSMASKQSIVPKPEESTIAQLHARILVVDDNEDNRMLLRVYFKKTACQIDMAENGLIAVDTFKTGSYDIVFMDMEMPVMDGYSATREIRRWESELGRAPTPIIAVTAHALSEHAQKSLDAGCDAHLTKPFKKSEIYNAVLKFAGQGRSAEGSVD